MKPSMLGLLIAAGAFGASTIYLSMQLHEERARTDDVLAQSRMLNARIADLERARADLESARIAGLASPFDAGSASGQLEAMAALTEPSPAQPIGPELPPARPPLERSEAMKKMMRTQLRSNLKRVQGDLGTHLGLSADKSNQLLDLLVEQQMGQVIRAQEARANGLTPAQRSAALNEQRERNLAEVVALIGADKIEAYTAYQETLPARHEVDVLSRQLEANDRALNPAQRTALVTALAEERQRVPEPTLADSANRDEYTQAMTAWQQGYNERAAARASGILDNTQQATYTEYLQWTTELRQQFDARRAVRGAPARRMPGGPPQQP